MTDLNIYNPQKVRRIIEGKDARIAALEQENASLKKKLKDTEQEMRTAIRESAQEERWKSTQGDDYESY